MSIGVDELRALFRASPTRALPLPGLISGEVAARLREGVRPLLRSYYIPDRGRYQLDDTFADPELFAGLAAFAGDIVEVHAVPRRARWTRMARGDYALYKNDNRLWRDLDRHLEVVLDFSAEACHDAAQVAWTIPGGIFWMPQQPLGGAVVDRRQQIQRYDRYLSQRIGETEVFRLSLALEVEA